MTEIDIHSKATYQIVYEVFSNLFLDAFLNYKIRGFNTSDSVRAATIVLQDRVAREITKDEISQSIIVNVYDNLKNDSELIEKAIVYYQGMKS